MNSNLARKRSRSTYPTSKMIKLSTIPSKEVPVQQEESTLPSAAASDEILPGDWLTAICQSLGEVPALYETLDDVQPQLIIDVSEPNSSSADPEPTSKTQSLDEPTAGPKIEVESSTPSETSTGPQAEPSVRKSSKTLREWLLDDCLVLSLVQTDYKLHIRLQKCSLIGMDITMSKTSVMMNIPTYVDFKKKIHHVNTKYANSSVICNNQLAIFSRRGELILHQIFHANVFKLKPNPLKIGHSTIVKIRDLTYDIDRAIENALVNDVLSEKILEQCDPLPTYYPNLMEEFILSLQEEIECNVYQLFQCSGCEISDPSQFNHSCMTTDYKELLGYTETDAFLICNVKRVVDNLKTKGLLTCFSKEFFKNLCYTDIESNLREAK